MAISDLSADLSGWILLATHTSVKENLGILHLDISNPHENSLHTEGPQLFIMALFGYTPRKRARRPFFQWIEHQIITFKV